MAESGVLKILYVLDILKRTDEKHPVNASQIIASLKKEGFKAERKSISNYIHVLRDELNYDIVLCENRNMGWYMVGQTFEDYELKMLVDAVASAEFLTAKNSRELIAKIKKLATKEGERIINSTKGMDETLKLVDSKFSLKFDMVMRAIADGKQLRFQYENIGPKNQRVPRKDGKYYQISPYYLGVWDGEYFIIANTNPYDNVSPYRVEMMKNIQETDQPVRPMSEIDELKDIGRGGETWGSFIKKAVHLQNGESLRIEISGNNHLRREIMKQFGNNLLFRDQGEEEFIVTVEAANTIGFYQWIAPFNDNLKIEGPKICQGKYKEFLLRSLKIYEDD